MTFLLIGTLWFWLFILTVIGFVTYLIEDENDTHGITSGIIILVALILFSIFGNWESVKTASTFIQNNPLTILLCAVAYIIIGVIWSFWKWYIFLKKKREEIRERVKINGLNTSSDYFKSIIPTYQENIHRIVSWMMYWPFSGLWTLTHNLIRDIFTFISDYIKGIYQKIEKSIFKEFESDEKEKSK